MFSMNADGHATLRHFCMSRAKPVAHLDGCLQLHSHLPWYWHFLTFQAKSKRIHGTNWCLQAQKLAKLNAVAKIRTVSNRALDACLSMSHAGMDNLVHSLPSRHSMIYPQTLTADKLYGKVRDKVQSSYARPLTPLRRTRQQEHSPHSAKSMIAFLTGCRLNMWA